MGDVFIEWEAPLYHHTKKESGWYVNIVLITLVMFGLAFYLGNMLFGIFILLAGSAIVILGKTAPNTAQFKINYDGVIVNKTLHPFTTLESFWMEEDTLFIKTNQSLFPHLVFPIIGVDIDTIKTIVSEYLPEEEYRKTVIDSIAEYINF